MEFSGASLEVVPTLSTSFLLLHLHVLTRLTVYLNGVTTSGRPISEYTRFSILLYLNIQGSVFRYPIILLSQNIQGSVYYCLRIYTLCIILSQSIQQGLVHDCTIFLQNLLVQLYVFLLKILP